MTESTNPSDTRDHVELRLVTAYRVDRLGALANQEPSGAVHHRAGLGLLGLDRHGPHRRTLCRLHDRRRVARIALLAFRKRLDVARGDQPNLVAERLNLPPPVMRASARLHHHQTRQLRREKLQHLRARELSAQHRRPARRGPMHLETSLRNVDADDANVVHGRSPCPLTAHRVRVLLAHRDAVGRGASTPSLTAPHIFAVSRNAARQGPPVRSAVGNLLLQSPRQP